MGPNNGGNNENRTRGYCVTGSRVNHYTILPSSKCKFCTLTLHFKNSYFCTFLIQVLKALMTSVILESSLNGLS